MSRAPRKRRWLQFSLRSMLLVTLAVALWLGYEVRETRQVERTIAALRALGGTLETESTGPSLLRLCHVPGYGQRIVRAEIPGIAVEQAIPLLRSQSELREVDVTYDGTFDPTPSWEAIRASLGALAVVPKPTDDQGPLDNAVLFDDEQWKRSSTARRLARFRARVVAAHSHEVIDDWFPGSHAVDWVFRPTRYRPLLLADGTLVELLTCEQMAVSSPGSQSCFAVLIVADKRAGVEKLEIGSRAGWQRIVVEDFNKDGFLDVGFELSSKGWLGNPSTHQLPGDSRAWLAAFRIERDGFKSLLPSSAPKSERGRMAPPREAINR